MASKLILYFVFLNAYEFKNWLLSYPAASVKIVKTTLHAHTVNNRKWPQKTNNRLSQSHRFSQRSFRVEQNPARSQKKKKNRLNSWVREKVRRWWSRSKKNNKPKREKNRFQWEKEKGSERLIDWSMSRCAEIFKTHHSFEFFMCLFVSSCLLIHFWD